MIAFEDAELNDWLIRGGHRMVVRNSCVNRAKRAWLGEVVHFLHTKPSEQRVPSIEPGLYSLYHEEIGHRKNCNGAQQREG